MTTTTVNPITRQTFKPYAKLGKSNTKIQDRICNLLFRICMTDDPAVIKRNCQGEIKWLEGEGYKPATRTAYVSAYRKSIQAWFRDNPCSQTLVSERETVKGLVAQHCALDYLIAAPADYAAGKGQNKAKTAAQRDNLTGFDAAAAVAATEQALQSEDWRELAVGLIMATQSRPSDMLSSGEFKAVSKYRLEFSSRAKKRGAIATGEIFCLVESATFIDAFSRLRRCPDVMSMKNWALKDVDSGKNKALNRAVNRVYGDIIPVPYGEKELSCKNLRAAGVNAAYWLHGRDNQAIGRFAELQLLHANPGTAANYEDFYATDAKGKRLLEIGVLKDAPLARKPKSQKRSTISVDAQMRDVIGNSEQWGEGSQVDRLERIIAQALRAEKLEQQLAREYEKRQQVERQNGRLRERLEVMRLEKTGALPEKVELVRVIPAKAEPVEGESDEYAFDWRSVPNKILNGDRRHVAYKEKLRRSVEAIQEYNAGLELPGQYAINTSVLRQMTKVKPELVKDWMDGRAEGLQAYKAAQGHTYQQNRGKPNAREVIKWSEEAYGEYDW